MADINALKTAFFVNLGDVVQAAETPGDPDIPITNDTLPQTEAGCRVTHLIDGTNYFGALRTEIDALLAGGTDRFFYTNSWWLGTSVTPRMVDIAEGSFTSAWQADAAVLLNDIEPPFELRNGIQPYHAFYQDIEQMSAAGVDVRVLVWATPFLVNFERAELQLPSGWAINIHSLLSVVDIRALQYMTNKVVLNTLAHTMGAMHLKMVVCGDSTGFRGYVSGLDFVQNRNARPTHPSRETWHDVGIKVEGSGANGLYHYFEQLWNEEVRRSAKKFKAFGLKIKSHENDTPLVNAKTTLPIAGGTHHIQVLRTLPAMNFSFSQSERLPASCPVRILAGFRQRKISFAEDGIFEFRAAQRKAINAAQNYIYIEDQGFWNYELAEWISARLLAVPALKVVLLYQGDPADPPNKFLPTFMTKLIAGVATPEDRVVFGMAPYTTHSKLTIIDDKWAAVGSSNCMRRSFYLDGEISVSILDEAEPSFAQKLRKDLWGEHCNQIPGSACDPLLPMNDALGIWRSTWGSAPAGFALRSPEISLKTIPFAFLSPPPGGFPNAEPAAPTDIQRDQRDADSRLEY